jgi:hypothetical protein
LKWDETLKDNNSMGKHHMGSIEHKIALAYHLQANFGHVLLQDKEIRAQLLHLDENIESTWKEMVSIGVVGECSDCALEDGSCCGAGMENRYDEVLLLINLLLGRPLCSQPSVEPASRDVIATSISDRAIPKDGIASPSARNDKKGEAYDTTSCYLLGENGCHLRAREVICVNYLCGRIYRNIDKDKLIHLQRIAGNELNSLFVLEQYIKKRLRGYLTPGL